MRLKWFLFHFLIFSEASLFAKVHLVFMHAFKAQNQTDKILTFHCSKLDKSMFFQLSVLFCVLKKADIFWMQLKVFNEVCDRRPVF